MTEMVSAFTNSLNDGISQSVATQILKANGAGLAVNVGDLPVSGDIIKQLDRKICRFLFAYGELPVTGEVNLGGDNVELRLVMEVGQVPYTIESRKQRERLLNVIRSVNGKCPAGIEVDRDRSIFVRGTANLDAPVTATRLISSIISMLFDVNPVLRSLGDHLPGLAQALPGSGSNYTAESTVASEAQAAPFPG